MSNLKDPEIFRSILESLETGIYVVNQDRTVLFWNDGAERITGYLRQDMLGRPWQENLASPENGRNEALADPEGAIREALRDGKRGVANVSLKHRNGHRIPLRMHTAPVRDAHGMVVAAVQSFDEPVSVADWDQRQNKLAAIGCLDPNTGVLNHDFILFHLEESLAQFKQHQVPFSICCVQVDKLEHFRQQYGPGAVTAIMRAVAQTLETSLRPTDYLGRLEEGQFLAILSECSESETDKVTQRLRKMVSYAEIRWWGDEISVTSSFGGTAAKADDTQESMLKRAQKLVNQSLVKGGDIVSVSAE